MCFFFLSTCFNGIDICISEHIEVTTCCKVQQMSLWKTISQGLLQQFPMHWQYPLPEHSQWVFLVAIMADSFLSLFCLLYFLLFPGYIGICSFGTVAVALIIYLILTLKIPCCCCCLFQWWNWFNSWF